MSESSSAHLVGKSELEKEEMLDRMLTRLALCDDSKLQDLLSKLLPLVIASLSSSAPPVRNKVIEILSHVNKRVKHQPQIGLPLLELWKLYVESSATPMVRNFCIVYIEMAIDRVPMEEQENISPMLLSGISKLPAQHQDILLRIIIKVIGEYHSSQVTDKVAEKYKGGCDSQDIAIFHDFCLQTLLYQPTSQSGSISAGLSISQRDRVTAKQPLSYDVITRRKLGILKIIEAMQQPLEVIYPLYIAAAADSQESVVKRGEELMKRNSSGVNFDDPNLISKLFLLFNGTESVAPESRVSPGNPSLKAKLLSIFCRSITAANSFPSTLQCIFGCIYGIDTTARLKQLGMEFTVWVFKHARDDQLRLMGPVILTGILKSLDNSTSLESDAIARDTKTFAYQAIGMLAQRSPHLFRDKIDVAVRLFDALRSEGSLLRLVIQEATNSLADAYKGSPSTVLKDLESLLLRNSQAEQGEVRFCAVRWATSLFDFHHCPSRYICMLGAADSKLDIREMAVGGLFPDENLGELAKKSSLQYPQLADMLDYILKQQPALMNFSRTSEKLLFPSKTFMAMIKFLLKCFETDVKQNNLVEGPEVSLSVDRLCLLLENAMAYEGSVELHGNASKSLVTVGSYFPKMIASRYADKVLWLKKLLDHIDSDTRESAARLLGFASSSLPISASADLVNQLSASIGATSKSRFEMQHGVLCALGYIIANCISREPTIPEQTLQTVIKRLADVINSESTTIASVAMEALGHIGLCTSLPSLPHDSSLISVLVLLRERLIKLLSSDDNKAIQKIVIALGHMCFQESVRSNLDIALDMIFTLCRSKVEDVLFAAGEALAFMWGGVPVTAEIILRTNYTSLSMASNFLMGDMSNSLSKYSPINVGNSADSHGPVRDTITRKLFDDLLYSSRKEERCAGTVWLVSLTMYCGQHTAIQQLLPDIQEAFSHLLSEQNELMQELASQGLSIVYELGDASMKKNLVNALVGTLTGSGKRKRAVKLVEDTEVFQGNGIGETPGGGKLSTYKELCNLANEMGQPDLIYKFMDLANYQASLNSKRGAAYGFSKIAKFAGEALQPFLRSLVPRLIRYQYDPDKNVQDAMAHIWKSLVSDPKQTIDEHLDAIIDDLLSQCGSRLWRSRESSCLALADIIQGRKFGQVEKELKRIWVVCFRAMDDIKESVRNSGDRLCRAVSSLTVRLCDVSLTPVVDARKTMDIVLPLLLTEGIMSKVDSVRKASIGIVMKLAKGSGTAIRPHLPDLVCCMLESLSSLEDQGLNYVEMHAANAGIQAEKLENLRVSIAKGSPMWETLDFCIDVVDSQSLELLVPRLLQLVRSGVGLNTRVGVASFTSLLVQKVGDSIKPFTNLLLKLLFPVVKEEKSSASKRAFANACAIVLKFASSSQAQKLIEDTASLHSGEKNAQISCGILLKAYFSMGADILNGYLSVIVPVIFISRFEDDKNVSILYEELWEENMGSERITVQLYLGEIVTLINEQMASSSWTNKRKAARGISKLCNALGDSLSPQQQDLLNSLIREIPGRLWEGKEDLLCALSDLCMSCHKAISAIDPEAPYSILSLVQSACTKKVKKYREAALLCLEQIIKAFSDPHFFNNVLPFLSDMCNSVGNTNTSRTFPIGDAEAGNFF
ncbi:scaffold/adaptor protein [Lithospermum erythrorhizon]|uniref:Scaffold/adaptor protein n=1 Tax=Lithospermum erythrorhizon TaxID=34254 RepID=A0AAV3Q7B0_LITER